MRAAQIATTGTAMKAARKAGGLTQRDLAKQEGVSREAVQYWEAKAIVPLRYGAPCAFAKVLQLPELAKNFPNNAHAGDGVIRGDGKLPPRLKPTLKRRWCYGGNARPNVNPAAAWSAWPRRARAASAGISQRRAARGASFTVANRLVLGRRRGRLGLPRRNSGAGRRGGRRWPSNTNFQSH